METKNSKCCQKQISWYTKFDSQICSNSIKIPSTLGTEVEGTGTDL